MTGDRNATEGEWLVGDYLAVKPDQWVEWWRVTGIREGKVWVKGPNREEIWLPDSQMNSTGLSLIEAFTAKTRRLAEKSPHQRRVEQFMRLAGQPVRYRYDEEPSPEERLLAAALLIEEVGELIYRGLGIEVAPLGREFADGKRFRICGPYNAVEVADGIADVSVVNTRILGVIGCPDLPLLDEVDQNNLDKFGPGSTVREDGKVIKPPNHRPPAIAKVLYGQS